MAKSKKIPPQLRRAYFDCRYGQLHVHNAIPAAGGFDELTALVCIHAPGQTGRAFNATLAALGSDRSIYALDLPGCGETDPAEGEPWVDAGVNAIGDFLDSMRIRKVDLLALGDGAAIARRLAAARPAQVRKLALLGEAPGTTVPALTQPLLPIATASATAELAPQLAGFFD